MPCGFTVKEMVVEFVELPDVPVTVIVTAPTVAVLLAESVKTLVAVAGFVPKTALTPFGRLEAARVTLPLNPCRGLIAMVVDPEAP